MPNIGVVVDNDFYNDVRVFNEVKILAESGIHIHVLCFNFGSANNIALPQNVTIHSVKIKRSIKNIIYAYNNSIPVYTHFWKRKIKAFVRANQIEHLHVHDLYMSKAAHLATKNSPINFNLDLHENFPAAVEGYKWMYKKPHYYLIRPGLYKKTEAKLLSYPENIVVLSETFRDDLLSKYSYLNKEQFCIYPNLPDLNELLNYPNHPNLINKKDDFILFYFGGIAERRGIFTTIDALKIIKHHIPQIKLLLIGPVDKAESERFYRSINNPDIKASIIYYEWKDISYLPSYINSSDVCLSPIVRNDQHESGVANKIFQYMLFKRPLLVSDCKPQKLIVENEKCGLAFESENPDDLAKKVMILYNDPKLRTSMGKHGQQAVLEKYNTIKMGKNLVKLYL